MERGHVSQEEVEFTFLQASEVSPWMLTRAVYVLRIMFNEELPKLPLTFFEK